MIIPIISIQYDEDVGIDSYRGVIVTTYDDGKEIDVQRFNVGDPVIDYREAYVYAARTNPFNLMTSSSVDNFVRDVDGFGWDVDAHDNEWLVRDDDEPLGEWFEPRLVDLARELEEAMKCPSG